MRSGCNFPTIAAPINLSSVPAPCGSADTARTRSVSLSEVAIDICANSRMFTSGLGTCRYDRGRHCDRRSGSPEQKPQHAHNDAIARSQRRSGSWWPVIDGTRRAPASFQAAGSCGVELAAPLGRFKIVPGLCDAWGESCTRCLPVKIGVEPPKQQGHVAAELAGARRRCGAEDAIAVGTGCEQNLFDEERARLLDFGARPPEA